MDDVQFRATMDLLAGLSVPFARLDLSMVDEAITDCRRVHTVAPILDPTAYRDGMDRLRDNEKFLRAVRAFSQSLKELQPAGKGEGA